MVLRIADEISPVTLIPCEGISNIFDHFPMLSFGPGYFTADEPGRVTPDVLQCGESVLSGI
jgi:hypothetical protein